MMLGILFILAFFTQSMRGAAAQPSCRCANGAKAPAPAGEVMGGPLLGGGVPIFPSSTAQSQPPGSLWGSFKAPLPTNQWWTNLVTGLGDQPINPYPYMVAARNQSVAVGYPKPPVVDAATVTNTFLEDVSLGFAEASQPRVLSHHDPLLTAMTWRAVGGATFDATFTRGSPYQTVVYKALTPVVSTIHAILTINGVPAAAGAPVTASRFTLTMNNQQTWILYTSKPIALTMSAPTSSGVSLTASGPFTGVMRVALTTGAPLTAALNKYANIWPAEAGVTATMTGKNTASVMFRYMARTLGNVRASSGSLLTCVLPHHVDAKQNAPVVLKGAYTTIKGKMTCVAAPRKTSSMFAWSITEGLTTVGWGAPRKMAAGRRGAVAEALEADAGKMPTAPDPYFFGKQVAAMGRLAVIADELGNTATAAAIRGRMKEVLAPWLAGTNSNPLKYDTKYGGITALNGLLDSSADFGAGVYNDHLFHWGYFAYAAAALGRKDKAWLSANTAPLDALLRDFANPRSNDKYLPYVRNKDWYDGHSWASGVVPFAAGKNQESSSEAVNGYYGVYLMGLARGDQELADWGRLLLAMELRSAKKYWQIKPTGEQIYPQPFAKNGVVGILWGALASYSTFFGANVEYIHCIQMLPFTPITEQLLPAAWIKTEYPIVSTALTRASPVLEEGWKGFIYMAHAIIDKAAAWREVSTLTVFDDGNSKTNTLYWVATRP
mmetsp:Transcript_1217/g.3601  ORF Transcript_1217/g.3601 Transcript_1217/m.3601 type:complete len:720 (+) Transcript_1217:142-2301(+)|eukprot:CAMPEP_0206140570 /NCGR_PEP_ID=MMETSP1473-20131121/9831_1 /ASSEMBLY_ACC=CAM_ASM_001109 /TAXON_ID=1461547 /ORGANISM="Stichococcus sp, Strain RCC1054" /LENGTH=719 /DNA_ID=CAMNT_0053534753 /DNA_START=83 /DNA_END=2242 /DNA_ORIENTATION=+